MYELISTLALIRNQLLSFPLVSFNGLFIIDMGKSDGDIARYKIEGERGKLDVSI